MFQRWPRTALLSCEQQYQRVNGFAEIAQVIATIEAEPQLVQTKKAARNNHGATQDIVTDLLTTS